MNHHSHGVLRLWRGTSRPGLSAAAGVPRTTVKRTSRVLSVASAFALVAAALWASPASAAPDPITDVTMTVSNNATAATAVTYTWNFTLNDETGDPALTFTVPSGTLLTPTTTVPYGLPGCTATTTFADPTVTVTLADCTTFAASSPVSIAISGFTNTTVATSTAFLSAVSDGTANASATTGVDFNSNKTAVTVIVPESLTFTNANTAITLVPVPGNPTPATSDVKLTVETNARGGYSLNSCVDAADVITIQGGGTDVIPQLSTPGTHALDGTTSAFGAQASVAGGSAGTTAAGGTTSRALQGDWADTTATTYVGYESSCGSGAGDATILTANGTTDGDVLTLTNAVSASAIQPDGTYKGTITYQVTPLY